MEVIIDGKKYVEELNNNTKSYEHIEIYSALDVQFYSDDLAQDITIREYLKALLETLWIEDEGFSGKRPLGNSGWKYQIYAALIKYGFIPGDLDEDGYVDNVDTKTADEFVLKLISSL